MSRGFLGNGTEQREWQREGTGRGDNRAMDDEWMIRHKHKNTDTDTRPLLVDGKRLQRSMDQDAFRLPVASCLCGRSSLVVRWRLASKQGRLARDRGQGRDRDKRIERKINENTKRKMRATG